MKDLYGDELAPAVYPHAAGYKVPGTSKDAAKAADARGAKAIRELVFAAIAGAGTRGLTADEAAKKLNMSVLTIRPRVSELRNEDPPRIKRNGERRANDSGLLANAYVSA